MDRMEPLIPPRRARLPSSCPRWFTGQVCCAVREIEARNEKKKERSLLFSCPRWLSLALFLSPSLFLSHKHYKLARCVYNAQTCILFSIERLFLCYFSGILLVTRSLILSFSISFSLALSHSLSRTHSHSVQHPCCGQPEALPFYRPAAGKVRESRPRGGGGYQYWYG